MHYRDIHRTFKWAVLSIALAAGAAQAEPQPAMPSMTLMSEGAPYRVKLYHAHYQVEPDFTYSERVEMRQEVLTEMGARLSRNMLVGMASSPLSMMGQARKIEVLDAYTLKKNGKHIPATRVQAAATAGMPPMPGVPIIAFQDVELGDTVVLAYSAEQQAADPPGNFVLNHVMTRFWIWDDVEISLTAPAAMKLRLSMQGVDAPVHTASGATQQWVWKFSNPAPVMPSPGMPPYANALALHVTSFATDDAEHAYYAKAMGAMTRPRIIPASICAQLSPSDGPEGLSSLANLLTSIYLDNAASFEQTVNGLNASDCLLEDGRPQLMALRTALYNAFTVGDTNWDKSYDYIRQLNSRFPEHPFVALVEAEYWIRYAWDARGTGYAGSVTPEGWRLFRERLQKAENVLLQSKPYASSIPLWYNQMLQVKFLLDRPATEQIAIFDEGRKRYPAFYPIYFVVANFMAPKWGGDWKVLDGLVNSSVKAVGKEQGEELYVRLYWRIADDMGPGDELFRDTRASWPRMKRGFEHLMARYPKSVWNLNNFAHFACMAGDRKTYRKLRKSIGKHVMDDAWQAQPSLDLCQAKFGA